MVVFAQQKGLLFEGTRQHCVRQSSFKAHSFRQYPFHSLWRSQNSSIVPKLAVSKHKGTPQVACSAAQAASSGETGSLEFSLQLQKFLSDQFLPLALLSGMSIGGETMQALSAKGAVLFGMLSILLFTPLAAIVALRLPLQPPELAFGLAVFCCMPTTLSSGVSLTQAVGGNTALALLLTVGSNLLGIFTMPFMLSAVLGAANGTIRIAPKPLVQSLIKTILVPLLAGASLRAFIPGVAKQVDKRRKTLAKLSALLLAMVPWMQISKAVADGISVQPGSLAAAVAVGVAIHLVFLAFNMSAVNVLKLGGSDNPSGRAFRRSLVLVCSQKTLSVAALLVPKLAAQPGTLSKSSGAGIAMVVCVFTYISQLAIDFLIASRWSKHRV